MVVDGVVGVSGMDIERALVGILSRQPVRLSLVYMYD